jgi:predicted alternative tryptophan synthase beta-subunit
MTTNFQTIEKEHIRCLKFPNTEVLQDKDARLQRNIELFRAQSLGNLEHSKIKIFFEDDESQKMVRNHRLGSHRQPCRAQARTGNPHQQDFKITLNNTNTGSNVGVFGV